MRAGAELERVEEHKKLPLFGRAKLLVSRGERHIAGWHFRAADEPGKMIDVGKAEVLWNILRISGNFAHRRGVLRAQPVRDTHFDQISVADEREQAAVLILPSNKASDARLPGRVQDRHKDRFAMDSSVTDAGLVVGNGLERGIVDRLYESIAQSVERCP